MFSCFGFGNTIAEKMDRMDMFEALGVSKTLLRILVGYWI